MVEYLHVPILTKLSSCTEVLLGRHQIAVLMLHIVRLETFGAICYDTVCATFHWTELAAY